MTTGYQLLSLVDTGPRSTKVAGDGTATVTFGPVVDGHVWNVFRIMVFSTSALPGSAELFFDDPTITTNLRGGTGTGQGDIDSNERLIVPATRALVVAWSTMTPGASCSAILQYEDLLAVSFPSSSIPATGISTGSG